MLREHREPEVEPDHSVAASLAAAAPRAGAASDAWPDPRTTGLSTYRLQIDADFDLFEAARRLPYLHDLGVDWVYLSPLLAAEPGSTHGYDVVALDHVDASRGGAEGLAARLGRGPAARHGRARRHRAQPRRRRHARAGTRGGGTCSQHGRDSAHAEAFDIDWDAGARQGAASRSSATTTCPATSGPIGHLEVVGDELRYHDHRFPIAPGTATAAPTRCTRASTTSWSAGAAATPSSTTGGSSRSPPWPAYASRTRRSSPPRHVEVRRWFDEGLVDGLRIDHPDGLRDPEGYLDHLASLTGGAYALVEKILEPGEELPRAGRPTAPPGTTRSRCSTGCSPTRPASSR